jgi:NADH-quinone oxidoreductase subunit N
MWAPDAYHGAPTPITAFMSVGVKAASFTLMVRLFLDGLPGMRDLGAGFAPGWEPLLALVAALSMTWGNVAAITQRNTKRLLAYSSIAQAGYLLLGVVAGNRTGYTGLVIYLGVYTAMNIGVFAVIVAMRRAAIEGDRIDDLNGLIKRAPGLAVLMTIFLLSLAGIPPTAGFVGKFYLFYALVETQDPWMLRLALLALLNTAVSAYYYMQIVKAMFVSEPDPAVPVCATSKPLWTAIAVAALVTIGVGVWPQPAVALSRGAVTRLATSERQPKVVRPTRRPPRR